MRTASAASTTTCGSILARITSLEAGQHQRDALAIHHVDAAGLPRYSGYDGSSFANPVLVVFADYTSLAARMTLLALIVELVLTKPKIMRGMEETQAEPPCARLHDIISDCQIHSATAANKVLVLIGAPSRPNRILLACRFTNQSRRICIDMERNYSSAPNAWVARYGR